MNKDPEHHSSSLLYSPRRITQWYVIHISSVAWPKHKCISRPVQVLPVAWNPVLHEAHIWALFVVHWVPVLALPSVHVHVCAAHPAVQNREIGSIRCSTTGTEALQPSYWQIPVMTTDQWLMSDDKWMLKNDDNGWWLMTNDLMAEQSMAIVTHI